MNLQMPIMERRTREAGLGSPFPTNLPLSTNMMSSGVHYGIVGHNKPATTTATTTSEVSMTDCQQQISRATSTRHALNPFADILPSPLPPTPPSVLRPKRKRKSVAFFSSQEPGQAKEHHYSAVSHIFPQNEERSEQASSSPLQAEEEEYDPSELWWSNHELQTTRKECKIVLHRLRKKQRTQTDEPNLDTFLSRSFFGNEASSNNTQDGSSGAATTTTLPPSLQDLRAVLPTEARGLERHMASTLKTRHAKHAAVVLEFQDRLSQIPSNKSSLSIRNKAPSLLQKLSSFSSRPSALWAQKLAEYDAREACYAALVPWKEDDHSTTTATTTAPTK